MICEHIYRWCHCDAKVICCEAPDPIKAGSLPRLTNSMKSLKLMQPSKYFPEVKSAQSWPAPMRRVSAHAVHLFSGGADTVIAEILAAAGIRRARNLYCSATILRLRTDAPGGAVCCVCGEMPSISIFSCLLFFSSFCVRPPSKLRRFANTVDLEGQCKNLVPQSPSRPLLVLHATYLRSLVFSCQTGHTKACGITSVTSLRALSKVACVWTGT